MTKAVETDFLVITAQPGSDTLTDAMLATMADAIPTLPTPDRLGDDAVQYAIAPDMLGIADAMSDRFDGLPIDINRVSDVARQKKMLIADLESTIIEQECLDELAKTIGKEEVIIDITTRAMRGELDFEPALKERVAMLKGMPESALQELYDTGITLMPGATSLLATLRKHDVFCGLVSGGFAFFAARIADKLNFNRFQCNDLNLVDGALDGTVVEPILGRAAKAEILTAWAKELGLSEADVLATGDGSNDLAMLGIAGMGVAFRAKPAVAESARYRITYGDLTALLYLQGYRQADFA
ncbi:MAG: phosphoserine phosphatase SerB [PS1 clade bacterium]|nr:phosphoserine phosphatase SerB [PS1 clade bacterium]MBL6783787.1 phosphoserine phosphatase SerB [PS1 clade bacterium]